MGQPTGQPLAAVDRRAAGEEKKSAAALPSSVPRKETRAREESAEAPEAPPRILLRKPVFQRHYESIVTAPISDDDDAAGSLLSLAPAAPAPVALPPSVQRLRARAPTLPASASASGSAPRAHTLVPGERAFDDKDRLFDLSVKLPTELRFDTDDDRRRFEELFGICLDGAETRLVEAGAGAEAKGALGEGLPDGLLELERGAGAYDVVVPRVRPLGSDQEEKGDGEEKDGDVVVSAGGGAKQTPSFDPTAPDSYKASFASPRMRRDKK